MQIDLSQTPDLLRIALRQSMVAHVLHPEPTEADLRDAPTLDDWRLEFHRYGVLEIHATARLRGAELPYRFALVAVDPASRWTYGVGGGAHLGRPSWLPCGEAFLLAMERDAGGHIDQQDQIRVLDYAERWCDALRKALHRAR